MKRSLCCIVFLFVAAGCSDPPDIERLQGDWLIVTSHAEDEVNPSTETHGITLTVVKNDIHRLEAGKLTHLQSFKIDPATKPKEIDLTFVSGPNSGRTDRGIYEFSGATLRMCIQKLEDEPRPTTFAPGEKQSGIYLLELKRK